MTRRARNGRFTAERTTETTLTQRVTDRVTVEQADTEVLETAPGWDSGPIHGRSLYLAQRRTQRDQALGLLALWDSSTPAGEPVPEWLVRQAVTILRAGPGATPLELTMGRSI